jgi:putrescine transport system permease protein
VASLILLAVSLVTFMVWYFSRKAEVNRKRAIQEAMEQTASEAWQPQPQQS